MKISNKEKIMLCVLGSIIVGFLYYQYGYLSQVNQIEEKIKTESEIKQKYDTAINTINSMEIKKSDIKILNAKINDEILPFYPTISQEQIIIELDKLLKDSGLTGEITFQPIVSNSVENSKKEQKSLPESSIQGIVDNYSRIINDTERTQKSSDTSVNAHVNNQTNNTDDSSNSNESSKKDDKKNTVQYVKCEVKFEGNYENVDKLLNIIGQNEKKIVVNSIKLSSDTSRGIKGTLNLEFYSVPKINNELESYLKWDLNNTYGKSIPFAIGTGSAASNALGTEGNMGTSSTQDKNEQENVAISDFIASIKPTASDLPTLMMGKAKDTLRTTYVYADSNSVENVEMILTQDGDKYYYKYKTSRATFPENYDGIGAEFIPASKNIVLDILSENRINGNDNSGIKLKIVNKTNKALDINVSGDDPSNPRVVVDGAGSNINVNKN